jgi:hypothetical protein
LTGEGETLIGIDYLLPVENRLNRTEVARAKRFAVHRSLRSGMAGEGQTVGIEYSSALAKLLSLNRIR